MKNFEGVQANILTSKNKFQLVSAGAGSGKTTIMIEKIANLILNENVDVDNLLVVTFTVLAASEMKERLIKKLTEQLNSSQNEEKERILQIIEKIKTASIDTIDGFNSKTIKKYFYELEISPNIEIVSDATRDYFLTIAMKKTIDEFSKDVDNVTLFLDFFGGNKRNFQPIEDVILKTYNNVINLENYDEFLSNSINEYVDSLKSENIVNEMICSKILFVNAMLKENYSTLSEPVQKKIMDLILSLNNFNVNLNLKANLKLFASVQFPKFAPAHFKSNPSLNEINSYISILKDLKKDLIDNEIDENFDVNNEKIVSYFTVFVDLLKNFINNYNALKQKNNLIDFNDLSRLMLQLLNKDNIRQELQKKYTHIFIDEYQDVNPLQDKLMNLLVGEHTHIFMVGDVKQSIYGFRGSSPEWFLNKYNILKNQSSTGDVFDMNVNFRSSPVILNFINEIFSKLMTVSSSDIDFKNNALIEPKRDDIENGKVEVLLVKEEKDQSFAKGVYSVKNDLKQASEDDEQAMLVAKIITEDLIGKNFYDANLKQVRPLKYNDIAILSRSEKDDDMQNLVEILSRCGIPTTTTNKLQPNESEGIKLILSILKCVAKSADDVDYLATGLSLSSLTLDDIIELRNTEQTLYQNLKQKENEDAVKELFSNIKKIEKASYVLTNSELFRFILDDCKLRYYILQKPYGHVELNLIDEFLNKLSPVEDGLNLTEFIDLVENSVSRGSDFLLTPAEDSVTIQTIHKSKGLEYPVVILYNTSKQFNYTRDNDIINFNSLVGLGIDYFKVEDRIKMPSLTKYAIKLKNNEKGYKEELRLLYVALTRAKNKLYIVGRYKQKYLDELKVTKNCYANMILDCFLQNIKEGENEFKNCKVSLIDEVKDNAKTQIRAANKITLLNSNFVYPNKDKFSITLKNTVTALNSEKMQTQGFKTKDVLTKASQYDSDVDKALIGTHYHKALENLDYLKQYEKTTDFDDVDYLKIEKAHATISKLTTNAINIKKEAEFMMFVPYNQLVESNITDKVLVQGVVDLIVENENDVTIVDYKFSHLKIDALKQKYLEQLKLYRMAVENAYKKPVKHMYIYSIETGELG